MPYQPYTKNLVGPVSVTFTNDMGISNLSMIGKSATASTVNAANDILGLPAAGAIDLVNGQVINLIGANGGPIEHVTLDVPLGGIVDVIANRY
jgi:hypothetical protein